MNNNNLQSVINYLRNLREDEYVCVTDIAGCSGKKLLEWFRTRQTIEFIKIWERVHNPDFINDKIELDKLSFTRWIKERKAIGIISGQGQYTKTYAHKDIAFYLLLYCNPDFFLLILKQLIFNPDPIQLEVKEKELAEEFA